MTTLDDRETNAYAAGDVHLEAGCSIELRCDATSANLIVEGVLDVWSRAALNAQLDQLSYTSNDSITLDMRNVLDIDPEVLPDLMRFANAMAASDRRLSILCGSRPATGWLYSAGIHRVAVLDCS